MSEPKTRPTDIPVAEFLDTVEPPRRREDAWVLKELFDRVTGDDAVMWGPSIVGYGTHKLRYASGRELDWPLVAFSPRKANLVLYLTEDPDRYADLLEQLGKHRTSKGCLYINKLADIDLSILEHFVAETYATARDEQ